MKRFGTLLFNGLHCTNEREIGIELHATIQLPVRFLIVWHCRFRVAK